MTPQERAASIAEDLRRITGLTVLDKPSAATLLAREIHAAEVEALEWAVSSLDKQDRCHPAHPDDVAIRPPCPTELASELRTEITRRKKGGPSMTTPNDGGPDLSVLESADGCEEHRIGVSKDEIVGVVVTRQWCNCEVAGEAPCNSYCDTAGCAIYRTAMGGFIVASESSDTSGHG